MVDAVSMLIVSYESLVLYVERGQRESLITYVIDSHGKRTIIPT